METWLILLGVLLPLAPILGVLDNRLNERGPRRTAVPAKTTDHPGPVA